MHWNTSVDVFFFNHNFLIELKGEGGEVNASQHHFPDFFTKQALKTWRSHLHAAFTQMSSEKREKSERTPPSWWHPWVQAWIFDGLYNFPFMWAMLKNGRLAIAFNDQQCQIPAKKPEFGKRKNQISIGRFGKQNLQFSYFFNKRRTCEKMAHVREYRQESSCGRPSSWTNFSFRDWTFLRRIQSFGLFGRVVVV